MSLLEIHPETHGVALEIAYATSRNFTGRPVYARAACYLREEAAARDHRTIGQRQELFLFNEQSPGFPFWLSANAWITVSDPSLSATCVKSSVSPPLT
jgi:hypothetical protein